MATCDGSTATLENLGQGLFGVQLEVTYIIYTTDDISFIVMKKIFSCLI